jgi:hypothetical protein
MRFREPIKGKTNYSLVIVAEKNSGERFKKVYPLDEKQIGFVRLCLKALYAEAMGTKFIDIPFKYGQIYVNREKFISGQILYDLFDMDQPSPPEIFGLNFYTTDPITDSGEGEDSEGGEAGFFQEISDDEEFKKMLRRIIECDRRDLNFAFKVDDDQYIIINYKKIVVLEYWHANIGKFIPIYYDQLDLSNIRLG